jgi:hypothetical protein
MRAVRGVRAVPCWAAVRAVRVAPVLIRFGSVRMRAWTGVRARRVLIRFGSVLMRVWTGWLSLPGWKPGWPP